MHRSKYLCAAAAAALACTLALTGCGTQDSAKPATVPEVRAAFAALGHADRLSVTFAPDVSDRVIDKVWADVGSQDKATLHTLLGSTAVFQVVAPAGSSLDSAPAGSSPWKSSMAFTLTTPGSAKPIADVRLVAGDLYVAADTDALTSMGADLNAAGPYAPALQALRQGRSLQVSHAALSKAAHSLGAVTGGFGLGATQSAGTSKVAAELVDVLSKSLAGHTTTSAAADGYTAVSVDAKGVLTDALDAIDASTYPHLAALEKAGGSADLRSGVASAPVVTFEVKIDHGQVTDLRFDLAQFADDFDQVKMFISGAKDHAALNFHFDTDFTIAAPQGALNVDQLVAQAAQAAQLTASTRPRSSYAMPASPAGGVVLR